MKCGKALYSVPWKLIGQHVDIRATATMVQVFHHGELVKTHVRRDKGRATDVADYPPVMWNLKRGVKVLRLALWVSGDAVCRSVACSSP